MLIKEKTFNALTGEETITEREETAEEIIHRLELEKLNSENIAAKEKAEAARKVAQDKLAALGLTVDDLSALGL